MPRPHYTDAAPGKPPRGYDIAEEKLDGQFAIATIRRGRMVVTGRTGRVLHRRRIEAIDAVLMGEWMAGTARAKRSGLHGLFVAVDINMMGDGHARRGLLERYCQAAGIPVVFRTSFQHWRAVWEAPDVEGVVFKRSADAFGGDCVRMKHVQTADYVCLGVVETPSGGHSIRLGLDGRDVGTINATPKQAREARKGRVVEVVGNELYASGALRHPRFGRWRDDK